MNFEGPVLPLQPTNASRQLPADYPDLLIESPSPTSFITHSTSHASMSSDEKNHLGIYSKNSSESVDCRSAPNSPQFMNKPSNKELKGPIHTLSPTTYSTGSRHSIPRAVGRASSAEPDPVPNDINPSKSLNLSSSPKISLSSRMRRQPTIDTPSFTREEFEHYTRVNQYKFLDIIGHGSYGIVRKATDDNDEVYAMKILNKKKLLKKGFAGRVRPGMKRRSSPRENIEREIAILKKLDHPNVVRLFEVLDDPQEDDLILVFEYIQNGPVMDKLPTADHFSEDESRDYFIDLMLGLEFLHSQHVIHRDIKPQNLLLDDSNRLKIADFGVSEEIERSGSNISRWAGTPAFVAPETMSSSSTFKGQGVDIWAAGVTLYCFVFGKVPWSPPSIPELYEMIQEKDIPIPEEAAVSTELQDLLRKLLDKDPDKRISLSEVRMHPWILSTTRTIPSSDQNCLKEIDISEEDIQAAIKPFYTPIHILMMIKQMARKKSLRNPYTTMSPSTSPRHTSVSSPISKSQEESHEESHELSVDAPTLDATSQVKREHYHNTPSICVENEPKVE